MSKLNIIPYDWGIASRVGNKIFINKDITNPKLYAALLNHEKLHSEGLHGTDLMIDFQGKGLEDVKKEYWSFVFTHPKSWVQFLPIWKFPNNSLTIDPLILTLWIITISLMSILLYL